MNTLTATRPRRFWATDDTLLRFALRLDATLTGLCGVALAAFADPVAALTGLTATLVYLVGAALVAYGLVVYTLARVPAVRTAGRWVIGANVACTLGAVLVVGWGLAPLTTAGVIVTLAMGAYTAVFAVVQYFGVRRLA